MKRRALRIPAFSFVNDARRRRNAARQALFTDIQQDPTRLPYRALQQSCRLRCALPLAPVAGQRDVVRPRWPVARQKCRAWHTLHVPRIGDSPEFGARYSGTALAQSPSMIGVSSARVTLIAALTTVCFACSGKTDAKTTSGSTDSSDAELGAKLTIPVGAYADCTTRVAGIRPHIEGSSGGEGTVTLSVAGDGTLNATLSFGQWLSGTVAFAATSGTTAGLGGGPFEIDVLDPTAIVEPPAPADSGPSNISVSVAAGTLVLAGSTLFISVYAHSDDTQFNVYSTCPIPTSLPSATIVNSAPQMGNIPSGSFSACTTSSGLEMPGTSGSVGGDLALTTARTNGSLTTTQSDGFPSICKLAFDDVSGTTAMLRDGQTCMISEPCGPPPSLGTSSAPNRATLTNMMGAIDISGGALFINVVGDAPADACGSHVLSLICPPAP